MAIDSKGVRAVAVGGGTGLPIALMALKGWAKSLTAVVSVADDGRSSGRLRQDLNMPPPGDIRNCLVALARNHDLAAIFQHTFHGAGSLDGHKLGNLILAGLAQVEDGFESAVQRAGRLLEAEGRVLPASEEVLTLVAETVDGEVLKGQYNIATAGLSLARVWIEPRFPASPRSVVDEIYDADMVVLGPGSLFTSLLSALLLPDIKEALSRTKAKRVFVCNVLCQVGETEGMSASRHLQVIADHLGELPVDWAVVNTEEPPATGRPGDQKRSSGMVEPDISKVEAMGVGVVRGSFFDHSQPGHHAPDRLEEALRTVAAGV